MTFFHYFDKIELNRKRQKNDKVVYISIKI